MGTLFGTKEDWRQYRAAVIGHWYAVAVGALSLIILLIQIASEATGWKFWPWWANLVVFVAAIHWGQFLAWIDMKKERDALRKYNISQDALEKLAEYRDRLVSIQNEKIQNEIELGGWKQRYKDLRKEIVGYIDNNISPAEARLFSKLGIFTIRDVSSPVSLNHKHIYWRSRVIRDHLWIQDCAQDYGRRKLRKDEISDEGSAVEVTNSGR